MHWKIWTGGASFWRTLPNSSLLVFLAAVFCLFGSLGFILDSRNPQETTTSELTINIIVRACFAVAWAFLGTRRMFKSMIPLAVGQVSTIWLLHRVYVNMRKLALDSAALKDKLRLDAAGAMILVISGYVLFLLFFQREGKRFFAAHTEIKLATEIHHSLVPELSFNTSEFEFFGVSFPSGAVGGDLVDVVMVNGGWFGYVADVSGHGVPAGVLMSMTKSAARMWLALRAQESEVLSDINDVLKPLLAPNMFVTFAYAAWDRGADLAFSSAGHVPLLHYRASSGDIEQCSVSNLPLGILPNQPFASGILRFDCRDILVIISDGFTETFDSDSREFGMAGIKEVVQTAGGKELREISTELRSRVLRHGQQRDDQTILLVRRTPQPPAHLQRATDWQFLGVHRLPLSASVSKYISEHCFAGSAVRARRSYNAINHGGATEDAYAQVFKMPSLPFWSWMAAQIVELLSLGHKSNRQNMDEVV